VPAVTRAAPPRWRGTSRRQRIFTADGGDADVYGRRSCCPPAPSLHIRSLSWTLRTPPSRSCSTRCGPGSAPTLLSELNVAAYDAADYPYDVEFFSSCTRAILDLALARLVVPDGVQSGHVERRDDRVGTARVAASRQCPPRPPAEAGVTNGDRSRVPDRSAIGLRPGSGAHAPRYERNIGGQCRRRLWRAARRAVLRTKDDQVSMRRSGCGDHEQRVVALVVQGVADVLVGRPLLLGRPWRRKADPGQACVVAK